MDLDKRIKNGMKPLTCFELKQAKDFVGKECYFGMLISDFADLCQTHKLILTDFEPQSEQSFVGKDKIMNTDDEYVYCFCLPCEWVDENKGKEKEKKYKPYTVLQLSHDIVTRKLSGFITFRRKADRSHDIYILRYNGVFTENKVGYACLGSKTYSMNELFEEYEVKIDNKWQPFGVEMQGEE